MKYNRSNTIILHLSLTITLLNCNSQQNVNLENNIFSAIDIRIIGSAW